MNLRGKSIILISSEPWGKLYISKHNYAVALAERGNEVFFLNPIDLKLNFGEIKIDQSEVYPNLRIVTYRPFFPFFFKFHFRKAFDFLISWNVKVLLRRLKIKPDIVWDFNCSYLYNDLSIFNAPLRIFNPVDQISDEVSKKKADLVISISDDILNQYTLAEVSKLRLNHGLARPFIAVAENNAPWVRERTIQVAYVGNLTNDSLDKENLLKIVLQNPDVDFHFIGPNSDKENNLGTNDRDVKSSQFLLELKKMENVIFHGIKSQIEISKMLPQFDALLLCYKKTSTFKCDNSHKVIEYMSSGRVIISTFLSVYSGSELIEMTEENSNSQLVALFNRVISDIEKYNDPFLQKRRKDFALQNTYDKHIMSIESAIGEINC